MKTTVLVLLSILFTSEKTIFSNNIQVHSQKASEQNIIVWLDDQFLEYGDSFLKKAEEYKGKSRLMQHVFWFDEELN